MATMKKNKLVDIMAEGTTKEDQLQLLRPVLQPQQDMEPQHSHRVHHLQSVTLQPAYHQVSQMVVAARKEAEDICKCINSNALNISRIIIFLTEILKVLPNASDLYSIFCELNINFRLLPNRKHIRN